MSEDELIIRQMYRISELEKQNDELLAALKAAQRKSIEDFKNIMRQTKGHDEDKLKHLVLRMTDEDLARFWKLYETHNSDAAVALLMEVRNRP